MGCPHAGWSRCKFVCLVAISRAGRESFVGIGCQNFYIIHGKLVDFEGIVRLRLRRHTGEEQAGALVACLDTKRPFRRVPTAPRSIIKTDEGITKDAAVVK